MKSFVRKCLNRLGYDLYRLGSGRDPLADLTLEQRRIITRVRPFTLTSDERLATLINATAYVATHGIPGDLAECGVWRGGSMMAVALTLLAVGDTSRSLYLFDTFEGMSAPTSYDTDLDGVTAAAQLDRDPPGKGVWCAAGLDEVKANLATTGYPHRHMFYVKGRVEDTIPTRAPTSLALLRLDTDWYESTRHELEHLFPRLSTRGILIIDDYGHWRGARKAVDEYFQGRGEATYLHRVDYTGRVVQKL